MQIANPIYDVVFKYLMDDNESAKMLISAIIEEEIESLEFLPRESISEIERAHGWKSDSPKSSLTIYRLDFSAQIKTAEGNKNILIEIQKAKYGADIMRFRKYLGEQYIKQMNEGPIPIVSIYFLGYPLEHTDAPVIKVSRTYLDQTTHKEIKVKEKFIESLTHDSYVIQIPYLDRRHRSELEELLNIFNQGQKTASNSHILNIEEDDYPQKYRPLIRRLQRAVTEPTLRQTMDIEDEILEELESLERRVEIQEQVIEENKKVLEDNQKMIEESKKELEDNKKVIEESKKELEDNKKVIEESKKELEDNKKVIEESKKELEDNKKVIAESKKELEEKDRIIEELKKRLSEN